MIPRVRSEGFKIMSDFNRKVEETTTRVGKTVGETTEKLEKEASVEFSDKKDYVFLQ